jgi:hypothetical protein
VPSPNSQEFKIVLNKVCGAFLLAPDQHAKLARARIETQYVQSGNFHVSLPNSQKPYLVLRRELRTLLLGPDQKCNAGRGPHGNSLFSAKLFLCVVAKLASIQNNFVEIVWNTPSRASSTSAKVAGAGMETK